MFLAELHNDSVRQSFVVEKLLLQQYCCSLAHTHVSSLETPGNLEPPELLGYIPCRNCQSSLFVLQSCFGAAQHDMDCIPGNGGIN